MRKRAPSSFGWKRFSQQPDTAFVLAALDLDEAAPNYATITDRLKTAASAEGPLMRARGTYVYALVRAGLPTDARIELERIIASPRPHPLLAELRAFVPRTAGASPDAGAAAQDPDAGKRASNDSRTASAARAREELPSLPTPTSDYRTWLRLAAKAFASHDYSRAEEMYRSALVAHPNDTEALSGLGDCARARGDRQLAISQYEQAVERNPSYLPAVGALADLKWENGDHAGASGLYRRVIELAPSSANAARAKGRLAELDPAAPAATPAEEPASAAPGATP